MLTDKGGNIGTERRMRWKLWLGAVALGGLFLWVSSITATRIESGIRTAAQQVVATSVQGLRVTVSGRDIDLTGLADGPRELARVKAALNQIAGRRVLRVAGVQILAPAVPYLLTITKDQGLTVSGNVPSNAARAVLAADFDASGLVLASGAPDGWLDMVKAALAALAPLQRGQVRLEGATVIITGDAAGPDQASQAQAALTGLTVINGIVVLDDGAPATYGLHYQHIGGTSLRGKLPKGLNPDSMARALGVPHIKGAVKIALAGPMGEADYLSAWAGVMDQLDSLTSTVAGTDRKVLARLLPGADAVAVQAALATGGFEVQITQAPPAEGAQRTNPDSGLLETFISGAWQAAPPVLDMASCQAATDAVLAARKVVFLPNSDQLEDVAVIAALAEQMEPCLAAGLRAEIGGHTDTSGDADQNLILSQQRAERVRAALVATGLPDGALTAKGFGAARPISENDTAEGRVKNRRTTVTWTLG